MNDRFWQNIEGECTTSWSRQKSACNETEIDSSGFTATSSDIPLSSCPREKSTYRNGVIRRYFSHLGTVSFLREDWRIERRTDKNSVPRDKRWTSSLRRTPSRMIYNIILGRLYVYIYIYILLLFLFISFSHLVRTYIFIFYFSLKGYSLPIYQYFDSLYISISQFYPNEFNMRKFFLV